MQKVYFTPDGVASKQNELYALHNLLLYQQCNLIQNHFDEWAENNFFLSPQQLDYLANMDPNFKETFRIQLAVAVYNRKNIVLQQVHTVEPVTDEEPIRGSKVFKFIIRLIASFDHELKSATEEDYEFVIRVEYR